MAVFIYVSLIVNITPSRYILFTFMYIFPYIYLCCFSHFLLFLYNDKYVYKLFVIFIYVIDIILIKIL
jgi:hypothetical protein